MQRGVTPGGEDRTPAQPCARCGGALVRSHRQYAGRGSSADVLRCRACGSTVTLAPQADASRSRPAARSRRHAPVDEGPPSNPVLDADMARRLLEDLDG